MPPHGLKPSRVVRQFNDRVREGIRVFWRDGDAAVEFLDHLEVKFSEAGFPVKRYRKPSNSKNATPELIQAIVQEADIVVESLAD